MNTFIYAILQEYNRTNLVNNGELSNEQIEKLDAFLSEVWASVTEEDFLFVVADFQNCSFYASIKKAVENTLKEYNLTFADSRCNYYLIDGVYDLMQHRF